MHGGIGVQGLGFRVRGLGFGVLAYDAAEPRPVVVPRAPEQKAVAAVLNAGEVVEETGLQDRMIRTTLTAPGFPCLPKANPLVGIEEDIRKSWLGFVYVHTHVSVSVSLAST